MDIDIKRLKKVFCDVLCTEVSLHERGNSLLVETPFLFSDGDPYQLYVIQMSTGILRLTDHGHTFMHLSYENDLSKFREGTRGLILTQILADTGVSEENGQIFIDTPAESLGFNIFRIGQAITKITDLTFLNRHRAESTFYEDLNEQLSRIVPEDKIVKDYYYTNMDSYTDYPIDFKIQGSHAPLFLFGIPNRDKARLTTITLERLLRVKADFDSILIFSDQKNIPYNDLARLSNAGGEMISSLDAEGDFSRKILRKVS